MGSLGKIAKRWKDVLDNDDVNFELTVEVTIAENSDIDKIPSGFPRITRCGCARTQGLSYEEPATDSEESDKEDQRLKKAHQASQVLKTRKIQVLRQKMPVLRHLPTNSPFFFLFLSFLHVLRDAM